MKNGRFSPRRARSRYQRIARTIIIGEAARTRQSRKGESCQVTNDCAPGLACQPIGSIGGICVVGVFNVAQTAKECALIDCTTADDCCTPPSNCASLLTTCLADAGSISTS